MMSSLFNTFPGPWRGKWFSD